MKREEKFRIQKQLKNVKPEVWLIIILIVALFLRLYFFVGISFNDDSYYLEFSEAIYKGIKLVPSGVEWGIRIAVYYPVVFFWKLFGISEISTSIYFILLSLASIIVTYFIGKELFNKKVGLIASFLLSIFPLDIIYSTQVGPEIPLQFFSALAILFFIKSEKNKNLLFALITGVSIGLSYLTKSVIVVLIPVLASYVFLKAVSNKKGFLKYFKKIDVFRYCLIIIGFLAIFSIQLTYFYNLSEEWFYGEKIRSYSFTHELNSNSDLMWYFRAMFNLGHYYEWLHDQPLFGFVYYFVILSTAYLLYKRDIFSVFLAFWFLFLFAFFEYGLQFYCTKIVDYCLYARHPRFLSIFSIPAMLLVSRFFTFDNKSIRKIFFIFSIIFLLGTSLFYTYQSQIFLRNGMGYLRETTNYLKTLPEKTIYIPDVWTISKFKFFSKYDDSFISRLKVYNCNIINCTDEYYASGKFIHGAYVVTQVNPYTYINKHDYPRFMNSPPANWILLKNISLQTIGLFSNFNPKVYYAP